MAEQVSVADRLRATFETSLIYQGFLDPNGTLLDANTTPLEGFTATPGLAEFTRQAVAMALQGKPVRRQLEATLPIGTRRFDDSLRPVFNGRGEVIGVVPEAVDITER